MPKGFSKDEMHAIKAKLIIKGKELISKYGYKKFGIRDLTAEVGIANGMFYKFFSSKEDFFYFIVNEEKEVIRKKINVGLLKYKNEPINALKSFYLIIMTELHSNPIMEAILLKNEYSPIVSKMTEEELLEEREKSLQPIMDLANYWQENGLVKEDIDINIVFASLRSLVMLWFHRKEIGEDTYPQVIDFLIERICEHVKLQGDVI
ncbi:TetR family transcriptional regulator [Alkalibaculum sp. M08DMB]|uniref:TetR family transcriptional regulator n=1 Tax=Alkalibaculum sporogenes TaxID=2655001 RepID=A0A6A7KD18_9FIRM|nr:TetR/AcrR family transcriptional regulator [Alkalibaculum sporogenes]MPW27211.1 TetR family transcriptional regulator [Alkalibaculum sporogenes]